VGRLWLYGCATFRVIASAPTVRSYLGHATESEAIKLPFICTNLGARYWD
jgi:hypothetical protein